MYAGLNAIGRTIVPTLRYQDVAKAIDWLCNAFGFEKRLVVKGDEGAVRYAELTFGDGMIMLGPVEAAAATDEPQSQPAQAGGAETQTCYLFVADTRAHCARAKAAGAEIVLDVEDEASAGRGYSCRDPEGHIWNFGTYDPWKRQTAKERRPVRIAERVGAALRYFALVIGFMAMTFASAAVVAWSIGVNREPVVTAGRMSVIDARPEHPDGPDAGIREAAERIVKETREQLVRERLARESAERAARSTREQAAHERGAKEAAERAAKEAQAHLATERTAREAAERGTREAREQLAKAGAERSSNDMREQAVRERTVIESAERIVKETREQLALVERTAEDTRAELAAERETRQAAERVGREAREQLTKERGTKEAMERANKNAREQLAKEKERNARKPAPPPRRRLVEQPSPSFFWQ